MQLQLVLLNFCLFLTAISNAFTTISNPSIRGPSSRWIRNPTNVEFQHELVARMSGDGSSEGQVNLSETGEDEEDESQMDESERIMRAKIRRANELRSQEVFMKKSTGLFTCDVCQWEFDPEKGDAMMIGGLVKPGTAFSELESNWRCPTCRASKDAFTEVTKEIAGFEVNQQYGLGGNTLTGGEKNSLIWGGLAFFFVLFLSGYGLS